MRRPETLLYWYGLTRPIPRIPLSDWVKPMWEQVRDGKWEAAFATIAAVSKETLFAKGWPYLNSFCVFHEAQYTVLHFAAYHGAPLEVVQRMVEMGGLRTVQNALGERPVDVARKRNHSHLVDLLEPQYRRQVPLGMLLKMQEHLHASIRAWDNLGRKLDEFGMRLPQLEPLLEVGEETFRFPVDFWSGSFRYELAADGLAPRLACFGASRVVGGSEGEVEITPAGVTRVPLAR